MKLYNYKFYIDGNIMFRKYWKILNGFNTSNDVHLFIDHISSQFLYGAVKWFCCCNSFMLLWIISNPYLYDCELTLVLDSLVVVEPIHEHSQQFLSPSSDKLYPILLRFSEKKKNWMNHLLLTNADTNNNALGTTSYLCSQIKLRIIFYWILRKDYFFPSLSGFSNLGKLIYLKYLN